MITSQKSAPCLGCGQELKKAFNAIEPGFEVHRCPSCGMGRTWPDVPSCEIGRYYPAVYYGKDNVRFNPLLERLTQLFRLQRARVVRHRVKAGTVLDVGCGRGFTLSYLKSLGFKAHGMEFSDTAAWHARNVLGIEVETGDFLNSRHQKDTYNAMIFWHSLEHLPSPIEALVRAHELLKKGGLLVVAVPNFDSLQARLFGRHWFHLDIPRHYFHFGKKTLKKEIQAQGFSIVQMNHFGFEQNPYGWIQSFYNALGFDPNFLYSILKNKTARTHQIRQHLMQAALTLILLPLFTLLSLVLVLVETALRQGGTIEVYAVKR
jgi:2-polyprenyl-3-methyl-5-hydroxy-6-metoxy-1,4-benzoquinol methylase